MARYINNPGDTVNGFIITDVWREDHVTWCTAICPYCKKETDSRLAQIRNGKKNPVDVLAIS